MPVQANYKFEGIENMMALTVQNIFNYFRYKKNVNLIAGDG